MARESDRSNTGLAKVHLPTGETETETETETELEPDLGRRTHKLCGVPRLP